MYVEKKATAAHGEVCASAKQEEMAEEGSAWSWVTDVLVFIHLRARFPRIRLGSMEDRWRASARTCTYTDTRDKLVVVQGTRWYIREIVFSGAAT